MLQIGIFLFVLMGITATHAGVLSDAPAFPLALQVTGGAPSQDHIAVGLTMTNNSDHEIAIQRGIEVDQLINFKWIARMQIQAKADCASGRQIRIDPGATFDSVPWDGYQCSNSCNNECDDHRPLSPGTYQFVVVTAEGKRLPSPSFTLP